MQIKVKSFKLIFPRNIVVVKSVLSDLMDGVVEVFQKYSEIFTHHRHTQLEFTPNVAEKQQ